MNREELIGRDWRLDLHFIVLIRPWALSKSPIRKSMQILLPHFISQTVDKHSVASESFRSAVEQYKKRKIQL